MNLVSKIGIMYKMVAPITPRAALYRLFQIKRKKIKRLIIVPKLKIGERTEGFKASDKYR